MARRPKRVFFSGFWRSKTTAPVKRITSKIYQNTTKQVKFRPFSSFIVLLLFLLGLIILSNQLTKSGEKEVNASPTTKEVKVFKVGENPTLRLNGRIEKSGVIQIVAQAPGIVSKIHVSEGKTVKRGQVLVSTGTNYNGASAASVQKQLAQVQYKNALDTFNLQKEIIGKQREIADKSDASADELRTIAQKSADETNELINLNESILSTVDTNLKNLEDTNVGGVNDSIIFETKQLKAQLLSGLNQARTVLRNAQFQSSADKPPAELSNLNRELASKQLDLQEKSLALGLETSRLQLKLAQISESTMFPSAPFNGTVERVHVRVGQTVAPGTPLVTLSGNTTSVTAVVEVPRRIAQGVNKLENSYLIIADKKIEATPVYISTEATNGQMYTIVYSVPEEFEPIVTDKSFIDIEIPVGENYSKVAYPFIPLDSVQQTQDSAVVFTVQNDKAFGKTVKLGEVQGNFVQILSGLEDTETIILDRNIISGDKVKPAGQNI